MDNLCRAITFFLAANYLAAAAVGTSLILAIVLIAAGLAAVFLAFVYGREWARKLLFKYTPLVGIFRNGD